jgi:hypothetical protein
VSVYVSVSVSVSVFVSVSVSVFVSLSVSVSPFLCPCLRLYMCLCVCLCLCLCLCLCQCLCLCLCLRLCLCLSQCLCLCLCLCLCREPNPNCLAFMMALVQSSTVSRNLTNIQKPKLMTEPRPLTKCLSNNVGIPLLLSRPGYRFPSLYFCLSPFTLFFRNVAKPFHFWWFLPNKLQFLLLVSFKDSFIGCVPKSNLAV